MTHNAEKDVHSLQRDDRGWFCLNCSWPGADFTYRRADALAHKESTRPLPPGEGKHVHG